MPRVYKAKRSLGQQVESGDYERFGPSDALKTRGTPWCTLQIVIPRELRTHYAKQARARGMKTREVIAEIVMKDNAITFPPAMMERIQRAAALMGADAHTAAVRMMDHGLGLVEGRCR